MGERPVRESLANQPCCLSSLQLDKVSLQSAAAAGRRTGRPKSLPTVLCDRNAMEFVIHSGLECQVLTTETFG